MFRKTYVQVNGNLLEENTKKIIEKYYNYEYYIGVVKNNCYHHGFKSVNDLIKGGINYLATSSLEEAIKVRQYNHDIPILCLEPILLDYIYDVINTNVTITVESLEYLKKLKEMDLSYDVKIHLKLDTGMHRLGLTTKNEVNEAYKIIKETDHLILEGIYTHFATSGVTDKYYDEQVETFLKLVEDIDLTKIPIIHLGRSLTLVEHPKLPFCNGIRLGIILYGFSQSWTKNNSIKGKLLAFKRKRIQKKLNLSPTTVYNDLKLNTVMSLYSSIISRRSIKENDLVGYGSLNKVEEDGYIYTVSIGYADGVTKQFKNVVIDNEYCPIIADCMDMIMVYSKNKYELNTPVEIFGNKKKISKVLNDLNTNAYHLFNLISNRVPIIHIYDDEEIEITY